MRFSLLVNSDRSNGGSYQSPHICEVSFDFSVKRSSFDFYINPNLNFIGILIHDNRL